jgi:hypothetical protein
MKATYAAGLVGVMLFAAGCSDAPCIANFAPEIACQGSTVTVAWSNPSGKPSTLTTPGGAVIDLGSGKAGTTTFVAGTRGNIVVSNSEGSNQVTLEVVAPNATWKVGYTAATTCTSSGRGGTVEGPGVYDPRMQATAISSRGEAVYVEHRDAGYNVDGTVLVWPAPPLSGTWGLASGTCSPNALGIDVTARCGP